MTAPLGWTPVTVDGFAVRAVPEAELWSQVPGDATAETIVDEGAWEGATAAPQSGRAMLSRWLDRGAWVLGLYDGDRLIGLYDVGRFVPADYLTGRPDGTGDIGADLGPGPGRLKHLTCWFGIRPAHRGHIPAPVLTAFTAAFMRHLWDLGIRDLVTLVGLRLAEGRRVAAGNQRRGWRIVRTRGTEVVMSKALLGRP